MLQIKDLRVGQWKEPCIGLTQENSIENSVQDCLPYIQIPNGLCKLFLTYPKWPCVCLKVNMCIYTLYDIILPCVMWLVTCVIWCDLLYDSVILVIIIIIIFSNNFFFIANLSYVLGVSPSSSSVYSTPTPTPDHDLHLWQSSKYHWKDTLRTYGKVLRSWKVLLELSRGPEEEHSTVGEDWGHKGAEMKFGRE